MVTQSRESAVAELQALQDGLRKSLRRRAIVIHSKAYSRAALVARIQRALDAQTRVQEAKGELRAALRADRALRVNDKPFFQAVKMMLVHGEDPSTLTDFALARPRTPRPRTAEEKVLAAAKNRATRAERNTMGPKQKKKIKGSVVGVVITPVTTDAKK